MPITDEKARVPLSTICQFGRIKVALTSLEEIRDDEERQDPTIELCVSETTLER